MKEEEIKNEGNPSQSSGQNFKKILTLEQYKVLRQKGTERPFTGKYVHKTDDGIYTCMVCGNLLFTSDAQFDSGTGWLDSANQIHLYRVVSNFLKLQGTMRKL